MKYPIGVQSFETIIEDGFHYVDKTDLVYDLTQMHICFLSRPRRFGKSLLVSTLEAYFLGRKELFKGLKIEEREKDWLKYPVFKIDFVAGNFNIEGNLQRILEGKVADWECIYGKSPNQQDIGERFQYVLHQAYVQTGRKAVVLVDEYDKPLLDVLGDPLEQQNRNVLKAFYSTFKAADADLKFVLLTGVTKFSQITVFSGFNQPKDISMDPDFDALCGITEEELYRDFAEGISRMAKREEVDETEMKAILKKRYDGYHFSEGMTDVYNPFSILNALDQTRLSDYWYRSGTPTYLAKLIEGHKINMLRLLSREWADDYFVNYKADVEDPLAMLYQSGYLTIKGYNKRQHTYKLDYPNDEVRRGFTTLVSNGYFIKKECDLDPWMVSVDQMLYEGRTDDVREAFTSFLASIPYIANKDERALDFESHYQYTFYLIFRMMCCCTTAIEKCNSKGRADIILEYDEHVYILEFKLDGTAAEALEQIDRQQYALPYEGDSRKLHKIGVSISSESRTVQEWEEVCA